MIIKLSNDSTVSKFVTKKWVKVNNLSSGQYSVNKNIRFKTSLPRSDLCDYSDAYIFVLQMKMIKLPKMLHFKNNTPFRSCISKTNSTLIDNAEDIDIVVLIFIC